MNNNVANIRFFLLLWALLLTVGCVSETNRSSTQSVDKVKALELHIQLAEGYIRKSNRESARHHLRKAFEIDRNSALATAAMAKLYELEGEPGLAEENYRTALRRDRKLTTARNDYGLFLYRNKRYEDAFEQFDIAASDLDYDNRARVLVNLGRASLHLGKNERAETSFRHALVLNRQSSAAMIELAELSFLKQDYASAKSYLDLYTNTTRPSARSLLLGIRIERTFGNKDREASYALALRNLFPYSREYLEYKETMSH